MSRSFTSFGFLISKCFNKTVEGILSRVDPTTRWQFLTGQRAERHRVGITLWLFDTSVGYTVKEMRMENEQAASPFHWVPEESRKSNPDLTTTVPSCSDT